MDVLAELPEVGSQKTKSQILKGDLKKYAGLLLLMVPGLVWIFVYHYVPIYGITLAFKRFRILEGILRSPWVGFEYFIRAFSSAKFWEVLWNTVVLAFYRLVFYMPAPIIFALLLNEIRHLRYKRIVQTVSYLPHFLSWVVVAGIFRNLLSPAHGILNYLLSLIGHEPIAFMLLPQYFRPIIIVSSIWVQAGWGSIIILAAITAINPELYDACDIDGGGRLSKLRHITLPGIMPVVLMIYILRTGRLLRAGFDQVFNFYNPSVYSVGDIVNTYVYRVGLEGFDFSYGTAIGFFMNIVCLIVLLGSNYAVKKFDPRSSLW